MTMRATRLALRARMRWHPTYRAALLFVFSALALSSGCRGAPDRAERAPEPTATPSATAGPEPEKGGAQPAQTREVPALPAAVAASTPAIVRVESYHATAPKPPSAPAYPYAGYRKQRSGMGVITEVEGYIVTSYSLLSKPDSSELVSLVDVSGLGPDTPHRRATVMGVEPTLDLAILRVEPTQGIQAMQLGNDRKIEPGEHLFAITGSHDGLQYVAGKLKELASKECYQESMSATMLRVDIELPKESLGGPIFSSTGELIGLHTRHADATASSSQGSTDDDRHILPIQLVSNIYEPLKKKRGVASPWTGFSVRSLMPTEQARFPVKRYLGGVMIEYVWKEGPAYKLGLRTGDVLMRFSYYPTLTVADFQKWLYEYGVGAEVTLHVLRGDEVLKLPYVIEARPSWAVPR